MSYLIEFKTDALKFISKQPKNQQLRIMKAINSLPNGDVKKMISSKNENLFRLRIGSYRAIFSLNSITNQITVLIVNNRGDVYKKFNS